jgi:hypothetical protein
LSRRSFGVIVGILLLSSRSLAKGGGTMEVSGDGVLYIFDLTDQGIVNSPEMAEALIDIYIIRSYGRDYLKSQKPLLIEYKNRNWYIKGQSIYMQGNTKLGPFRGVLRAYDGALLNFGASAIFD